jgi:CRISPR-associated protein Cas8c/Csd1, subtype I-C/DVULG
MILQALKEYYDRLAADPESGIAPEGWEWKEIPFILVLDKDGKLARIEDTREATGKKLKGKTFLVPQAVKRAVDISANLLWDTPTYVFGITNTDGLDAKKKANALSRAPLQKESFAERIKKELPAVPETKALLGFLSTIDQDRLSQEAAWKDLYETNANLSFRFDSERELLCQSKEIREYVDRSRLEKAKDSVCSVTGEMDRIAILHSSIKGVYGTQTAGGSIVAFNFDSALSYNLGSPQQRTQGKNAPVGESAMFAYTTALNRLLAKESPQHLLIGDASTVFWSAEKTRFESDFAFFFSEPSKDDPSAGTRSLKNLLESPKTGSYQEDRGDTKFYILGLSPNAARISVRFWEVGTIFSFSERIRQHFEDLFIVKPPSEPEYYSLWRLLVNAAIQDKSENIPPNLAGEFMRAIMEGRPYPATILQQTLRRIQSDAENRVKPVRAALVKAYLNRYLRAHPNKNEKEITMALDTEQPSIGYQLGRLFAVLEKIQEEANPGLNTTIKERYYGAACSSPVTVFGTLMRLKNHHLAKMDNKGRVTNLERLVSEIVSHIDDFPAHLDLHEQGKFAIGYYHQRQDLFTKKEQQN